MRNILIALSLFFGCQSDDSKEFEQYQKAYEYLSEEHPSMTIRVMDTVQYMGLTAFSNYLADDFEAKSSTDLVLYLDSLDSNTYFSSYFSSEIDRRFTEPKEPTHLLYFSKCYKDYLLVELFELANYQTGISLDYKRLTTMGESNQYLFVFGNKGQSIKKVHKLTMAYN